MNDRERKAKQAAQKRKWRAAKKAALESAVKKPSEQKAKQSKRSIFRNSVIKILVKENPKRAGTSGHKQYAAYVDGMTVDAYLKAGGTAPYLRWDIAHKFVSLS